MSSQMAEGKPDQPANGEQAVLILGRRQRLGDQLYGQMLEQIVSGRLPEGTRLPSEKEICRMFGVSRPVVRQALLRLGADGLVQARQGAGTFVMARPADRLSHFTNPEHVAEFLRAHEIRLVLEGSAARLAAERRTETELARIVAAQETCTREAQEGSLSPEADLAFHASIAEATGNAYFSLLFAQLQEAISGFMSLSLQLTHTSTSKRITQVLHEHALILEAVQMREPEAAQISMRFHINQARRRMIDRNRD